MLLFVFLSLFSVMSLILNNKHLLSMLLSLEVFMVALYCLALLALTMSEMEMYYSLIILTFAACEAAVGLSVLVNMISSHGSSYMSSLNLMQC